MKRGIYSGVMRVRSDSPGIQAPVRGKSTWSNGWHEGAYHMYKFTKIGYTMHTHIHNISMKVQCINRLTGFRFGEILLIVNDTTEI